jgi:hypothetical protein
MEVTEKPLAQGFSRSTNYTGAGNRAKYVPYVELNVRLSLQPPMSLEWTLADEGDHVFVLEKFSNSLILAAMPVIYAPQSPGCGGR